MNKQEMEKLYFEYCAIKTKALSGNKVSRAEAMKALRIKKKLVKNGYKFGG